nr:hypothetical protein [uncultured Oscillibacter sp.]
MNDYRITYTSETGEESNIYVTERSEAAAKKSFLSDHKGMGFTVQSIELHRENTSATKQQERDTLAVIRKMVEELGPQSYLATAFEGCFEDAEQNIEDDAAYSMKARLEIQAQRAIERGHEVDRLKADLTAAQSKIETLQSQFDFASQYIKKLERQQLSEELRRDLWVMVTDEAEVSRARMAEAADKMAAGADNPGCVLFKESVARYRAEKARAEAMEQRAAELDALEPKNE